MSPPNEKHLSTTALARLLGKESKELFVLLTGGGWIVKVDNHWQLTEKGKFEGGIYVNHPKYGEYIAWPESVHQHPLFALLPEAPLTATNLGHKFSLPARLINVLLAERGWVKKYVRGWQLTPAGKQLGGQQHESEQSGIPYVTWPETLLEDVNLLRGVAQLTGDPDVEKFPTLDGRRVKNTAARQIANWLYLNGVVAAQDYELTVDNEGLVADFFLPDIQLFIDHWSSHSDAAALAQQLARQAVYKKYKLNFIELHDEDLAQLDEVLARSLLRNGLAVY
jgi:hypothetical protein